jgi:hypothetical protein
MPKKCQSNLSFRFTAPRLSIYRNRSFVYEITVWPRPRAEALDYTGYWHRAYPEFRLIDYPLRKPKEKKPSPQLELGLGLATEKKEEMTKLEAYDLLRQTMPFPYAIALAPFKSHQWNPLIFLSMKRRFYDLLKSSPVLAYLLANDERVRMMVFGKQLMLDDMTGMKQAELLNLLDLPSTKTFAQIFRKITPASARPELTAMLRHCSANPDSMKKLAHLQKVNLGALTLLTREESILQQITPQLLEEVSQSRSEIHYATTVNRLSESIRWHQELRAGRPFPVLRSREALNAYHEEISAAAQQYVQTTAAIAQAEKQESLRRTIDLPFGEPPIPGTDTILPLKTPRELIAEGHVQHNCVGSYVDRVRSGDCCIYRVLEPERATLSIVKASGSDWMISELYTACNKPVKSDTLTAVKEWLSQTQVGI